MEMTLHCVCLNFVCLGLLVEGFQFMSPASIYICIYKHILIFKTYNSIQGLELGSLPEAVIAVGDEWTKLVPMSPQDTCPWAWVYPCIPMHIHVLFLSWHHHPRGI